MTYDLFPKIFFFFQQYCLDLNILHIFEHICIHWGITVLYGGPANPLRNHSIRHARGSYTVLLYWPVAVTQIWPNVTAHSALWQTQTYSDWLSDSELCKYERICQPHLHGGLNSNSYYIGVIQVLFLTCVREHTVGGGSGGGGGSGSMNISWVSLLHIYHAFYRSVNPSASLPPSFKLCVAEQSPLGICETMLIPV